jgi:mitochondrial fission protein ELM1
LQALRRASEGATFTVILQHTGTRSSIADLIWCPMHEGLAGPNVISTLTSPHVMRPHKLAAMRKTRAPEIAALSGPLVAVLLGGPNRNFQYDAEALERLGLCLRNLATRGASFLITPSRRTTASLFRAVTHATRGAERIIWAGRGDNPYWTFLAHADVTIVTADSINMTSEACVTGRPVYVFNPDGGSESMRRFHAGLHQYGATRALTADIDPQETWSYRPLDAAPKIAAEIACRFHGDRTSLGKAGRAASGRTIRT